MFQKTYFKQLQKMLKMQVKNYLKRVNLLQNQLRNWMEQVWIKSFRVKKQNKAIDVTLNKALANHLTRQNTKEIPLKIYPGSDKCNCFLMNGEKRYKTMKNFLF